jgi:hypothetical protein
MDLLNGFREVEITSKMYAKLLGKMGETGTPNASLPLFLVEKLTISTSMGANKNENINNCNTKRQTAKGYFSRKR